MTCIIGFADKDVTWLVGDSMSYTENNNGYPCKASKVFKIKDKPILIGYTTSFRMGQLLEFHPELFPDLHRDKQEYDREYLVTKVIPNLLKLYKDSGWDIKAEEGERGGGTFLVGVPNHVYLVQSDFSVLEAISNYDACGCGIYSAKASVATAIKNGVTDIKEILKTAMEVTTQYSPGVQPPFHYCTTKGDFDIF